jgi:hypothetical protein
MMKDKVDSGVTSQITGFQPGQSFVNSQVNNSFISKAGSMNNSIVKDKEIKTNV